MNIRQNPGIRTSKSRDCKNVPVLHSLVLKL